MSKWIISTGAALAALLTAVPVASATLLAPGAAVVPGLEAGTFTALASTGVQAFNDSAGMTGIAEAQAGNFTGNPFGANKITFVFQVKDTTGQVEHLTDKSLAGAGVLIDVGIQASLLPGFAGPVSKFPNDAQLSVDGSIVAFDFTPPPSNALFPGETSYLLIVNTNQTSFSPGSMGVIDGGGVTLAGYSLTPEPASIAIALAGLPCLALGRWLRRKRV